MPEIADRSNANSLDAVLADFDARGEHFNSLCRETRGLLERLLASKGLSVQSIQHRVKGRDKVATKYKDPAKSYVKLTDITDLVGFRLITYYEDEVDGIAEFIREQFVADSRSNDARARSVDSFGYHALNLVCSYTQSRLALPEHRAFTGDCFEIQVTSILRHAWSEMEHSWYDLRGDSPEKVKRRYARLAALLEIAEDEFQDLRKLQRDFKESTELRLKAGVSAINAGSSGTLIDQDSPSS